MKSIAFYQIKFLRMKLVIDFVKSIRILNLLAILVAQVGIFSHDIILEKSIFPDLYLLIFILLSTFFLVAAGNIHNDCSDKELDKHCKMKMNSFVNSKYSLPSYIISYILSFLVALSLYLLYDNKEILMINTVSIVLIVLYNISFKKVAFIGNVLISLLCVLSIVYAISSLGKPLVPFFEILFLIFSYTFCREWVKDLEDKSCDEQYDYKTLAILLPEKYSGSIVSALVLSLSVFVYIVTLKLYVFICVLSVALIFFLLRNKWKKASLLLKIILISGILELYYL